MSELFENYIKAGLYLRGWSPKTAVIYRRAFTSFQQSLPVDVRVAAGSTNDTTACLRKAQLEAWIIARRQAGMSPCGVNIYIRAMNSFSAWLKEEGHAEQIVLKQLKAPIKAVTVFSDQDIHLLLAFKPRTFTDTRLWTLTQLLLDTGCRINELLSIENQAIDLDNLILTVNGKGDKQRKVPFSIEARKVLWRYCEARRRRGIPGTLLFSSHSGSKLMYRNIYRDIIKLCLRVGITKRVHPHLTRHTFACHFMKNGGSIYSLSRILGHSSVSTTQLYIRGLGVEDFKEEHARLSPLSRLR
jgi:integrase/recombinase XerD